jgi:hypothetical protein
MGSIVIRRGNQIYILDVVEFFRKGLGSGKN